MLNEEISKFILCCISSEDAKHVVENAIVLSCGHNACKLCIKSNSDMKNIKCNVCNKVNERELDLKIDTPVVSMLIQQNMKHLMRYVQDKFKIEMSKFKNALEMRNDYINTKVEFAKEEIEIRIESLKIQLDKLKRDLFKELDDKLKDMLPIPIPNESLNENNYESDSFKFDLYEKELKNLESEITNKKIINEKSLISYQSKIRELKYLIDSLNSANEDIDFKISNIYSDERITGLITGLITSFNMNHIKEKIKNGKLGKMEADYVIYDMCVLPNGYVLATDYDKAELQLFDHDFKVIKRINKIDEYSFNPIGIDTNGLDEIFIADFVCIIVCVD